MIKKFIFSFLIITLSMFVFLSCGRKAYDIETAVASLNTDELAHDVEILSSDDFEGRFPASPGEEKTINFLKEEFEKVGLKPGNGDSFFQEIPLVEIDASPQTNLVITGGEKPLEFAFKDDFVAVTMQVQKEVTVENSEMIFVGYGIVAPEYQWNDYEGIDAKGKTVVMLVNDPGFATQDPELFNGRAMTYYGRWTYKYEEAARQGAACAVIIHETEPAAYGWDVVRKGWTGPNFSLVSEDGNASRCVAESWITLETTRAIFKAAGKNYDDLKKSAEKPGFKAIPLSLKASLSLENSIKNSISRNVIGLLPGTERADEYIIYTAHWDHFGRDPNLEGDQIYNGALDNATGTAALIELAEAFQQLSSPPQRSILFMAVTAEEQGLLGSDYYATHPIYPLTKTVAVINMDSLNIYGRMKDIRIVGYGQSELDDYVKAYGEEVGRVVLPNPTPEKGSFFRSDHFPFAKQGVPALSAGSGIQHLEKGEQWGLAQKENYIREKYHKPFDEFDPNWDLSGILDDLHMYFMIGWRLSGESTFPNWKEGSEFKLKRDADMVLDLSEYHPYYYQKKTLFEKLPDTAHEIIFLGDSITDGGNWIEMFQNLRIKNRGISGDITDGVLERLAEVTSSKPDKVFLMIGINDLAAGKSEEYVVNNISRIVKKILNTSASTKIYLQSLLPVNRDLGMFPKYTDKTQAVLSINARLKKVAEKYGAVYIDLYSPFTNGGDKLNPKYTNDGLHLTGDGYILWKSLIKKYVKK
jgi:Zn-dependent M28 family amino/carboxypeptidase/lysophospholipase L1-like esterase